eukprot:jgi/Ulvmu1/8240/UM041_0050.1
MYPRPLRPVKTLFSARVCRTTKVTKCQAVASMGSLGQPRYHVAPEAGWINDPNGPLHRDGVTHIFYQHVEDKTHWDWGLVWGHAVSHDGVRWEHQPVALRPTARSADTSGCWSGCVVADDSGQMHALYTGVRLKGAAFDGPATHPYSATEPMIETVMLSSCTSDNNMVEWSAGKLCITEPPPEFMDSVGPGCVEGWRDPFIVTTEQSGSKYRMIIGSGYCRGGQKNGCVLQYSAHSVKGPWLYDGIVAEGDWHHGRVWECPALVQVPPVGNPSMFENASKRDASNPRDAVVSFGGPLDSGNSSGVHLLLVGAYEAVQQHKSWSFDPVMAFLGQYDGTKFVPEASASQGERVDIGDAPYAANVHIDGKGRVILWLWLRDPRPTHLPAAQVCGCLALPRMLTYTEERGQQSIQTSYPTLFQQPLPELVTLRKSLIWMSEQQEPAVRNCTLVQLPHAYCNCEITVCRNTAAMSGLVFRHPAQNLSLLIWLDWNAGQWGWAKGEHQKLVQASSRAALEETADDLMHGHMSTQFSENGKADGESISLSVFVDGTAFEAFTSSGKAASTRMYWEAPGGLLVSVWSAGGSTMCKGSAWEMGSIWMESAAKQAKGSASGLSTV